MSLSQYLKGHNQKMKKYGMIYSMFSSIVFFVIVYNNTQIQETTRLLALLIMSGCFYGIMLEVCSKKYLYSNTNFDESMTVVFNGHFTFEESISKVFRIESSKERMVLLKNVKDGGLIEISAFNLTENYTELK